MVECTDRKTAARYMDAMKGYHFGDWVAFLEPVNNTNVFLKRLIIYHC